VGVRVRSIIHAKAAFVCCRMGLNNRMDSWRAFMYFALAGLVQEMVAVAYPDTKFVEAWQITILIFAFTLLVVAINIWGGHHLPLAEGIILFAHIFAFFAFLVTFWVMADHAPVHQVFTQFYNGGGWPTTGLSCMVGLTSPIWSFIG